MGRNLMNGSSKYKINREITISAKPEMLVSLKFGSVLSTSICDTHSMAKPLTFAHGSSNLLKISAIFVSVDYQIFQLSFQACKT